MCAHTLYLITYSHPRRPEMEGCKWLMRQFSDKIETRRVRSSSFPSSSSSLIPCYEGLTVTRGFSTSNHREWSIKGLARICFVSTNAPPIDDTNYSRPMTTHNNCNSNNTQTILLRPYQIANIHGQIMSVPLQGRIYMYISSMAPRYPATGNRQPAPTYTHTL